MSIENYELCIIEKALSSLHLDVKAKTLEDRVWKLCVQYRKMLKDLEYVEFIDKRPHLAVQQLMSRITYGPLRRRENSLYKLNQEDYKKNFALFVRNVAQEAKTVEKAEIAYGKKNTPAAASSDTQSKKQNPRNDKNKHKDSSKNTPEKERDREKKKTENKRKKPSCLNPNCDGYHYVMDYPMNSEEDKKKLLDERRAKKRKKDSELNGVANQ